MLVLSELAITDGKWHGTMTNLCTVHFISVSWPTGSSGKHERWFKRNHLPVFPAGGHEQFWHAQGCPLEFMYTIRQSNCFALYLYSHWQCGHCVWKTAVCADNRLLHHLWATVMSAGWAACLARFWLWGLAWSIWPESVKSVYKYFFYRCGIINFTLCCLSLLTCVG